jgi:hypothetical protein
MDKQTQRYRKEEIERAEHNHNKNFNFTIKISGTVGSSKYLDITGEELQRIKDILTNLQIF